MLRELYGPLQLSGERLVVTDPESSELIKYAANTILVRACAARRSTHVTSGWYEGIGGGGLARLLDSALRRDATADLEPGHPESFEFL